MLAFLRLFLKFYLWIRHTDEMRSMNSYINFFKIKHKKK